MAFNLFQNILNSNAKKQFTEAGQQIQKSIAPVTQMWQWLVQHNKQAIQPVISKIGAVGSSIVAPVQKSYSNAMEKARKSKKVADYLKNKWITADMIKQMAEDEGTDPNEAFSFFKDIWVELEWINKYRAEAMQAKEQDRLDARPLWQKWGKK